MKKLEMSPYIVGIVYGLTMFLAMYANIDFFYQVWVFFNYVILATIFGVAIGFALQVAIDFLRGFK